MRHHTTVSDMTSKLNDSRCGILKKEQYFVNDSTDAKSCIMDHAYTGQQFLVAIRSKMNLMGHCIGILQNMIVDATLMDGTKLSCICLDAVLEATITEII